MTPISDYPGVDIRCVSYCGRRRVKDRSELWIRLSVLRAIRPLTTLNGHRALRKADAQRTYVLALNGRSAPMLGNHSITSSACSSSDCGIVIPSALAVFRLIASTNFVGCSTGRSAGLAPFRIRST